MIYVGAGVLLLVLGLWLMRAFVEADPAKLARGGGWFLLMLGGSAAVITLVMLAMSGRLVPALAGLGGLAPLALRLWRRRSAVLGPPPGQVSEVETTYLRMTLDHDSGTMSGTVRQGPFKGRRLDELSTADLLGLWRDCRAEDEQAATLLESYLDRFRPDWREAAQDSRSEAGTGRAEATAGMTRDEAYAILGLSAGAAEAEIRDAHRRLMMKLHPDHGGSTYLAAKLNRAREILLGG